MKYVLLTFLLCVGTSLTAQKQYAEDEPTSNIDGGIYYQTGPGSNNTLNWKYPYGTKLTVSGSACCRNFEILSTAYPYGDLKFRQWDASIDQWTGWRSILMENQEGNIDVPKLIGFKRTDGALVYGIGHENGEFVIGRNSNMGPAAGTPVNIGSGGSSIKFSQGTTERMRIADNGNVGIGIDNPISKLHIGGNITNTGHVLTQNPNNSGASVALSWQSDIARIRVGGVGAGASNGFHFQGPGDKSLLRILGNGSIGIGTTTPDAKLAVNGNIHTREVKVDLQGWPDYVFEDTYNLPTLNQVEQHILQNGHLINIPSAAEVAENGIYLGEMNAKLLEKIEELTLYTIAQEKEIEELKKQTAKIQILEEQIQELITTKR